MHRMRGEWEVTKWVGLWGARQLTPSDKFIVLASDGVWDYLSDQDAVDIVTHARLHNMDPAAAVRQAALEIAAHECDMKLEELLALPPGRQRRYRHDDTTCVVLELPYKKG